MEIILPFHSVVRMVRDSVRGGFWPVGLPDDGCLGMASFAYWYSLC